MPDSKSTLDASALYNRVERMRTWDEDSRNSTGQKNIKNSDQVSNTDTNSDSGSENIRVQDRPTLILSLYHEPKWAEFDIL